MENKEYSLLILGNFTSIYIVQFVRHLKKQNPNAHLFFWGYQPTIDNTDADYKSCYDEYYLFEAEHSTQTSFLQKVNTAHKLRVHFSKFASNKHFDYVNIHYIKPDYFFVLDSLKRKSTKLVLSPWGSDVYRIHGIYKWLVKGIFKAADCITGCDNRFTHDFIHIFNVPECKLRDCELGDEAFDYIVEHKNSIDSDNAKKQLSIDNHYVISCGYNASEAHQHMKIIDAISQVKNQLPENTLLLFPLTYPDNPEYKEQIKKRIHDSGLKAVYFEQFLNIHQLFLIRQATDMFIHVQVSDAASASLCEYLLCEKKIINGTWLQYPELKKNNITPYFEVESIDQLSKAVVNAYHAKPIKIGEELIQDFERQQWKVVIKKWDKMFKEETSKHS